MQRTEVNLRRQATTTFRDRQFPANPERYVHNFSSMNLDQTTIEVLSLGPKFCCPNSKVKQLDLELQFENLYSQMSDLVPSSDLNQEKLKSQLVATCYQYLTHPSRNKGLLSKEHFERLTEIRRNKDIILLRPDKGSGIVLLDRAEYVSKMKEVLQDTSKFTKTEGEKDKTVAIEKGLSKTVRKLKQDGVISSATFERIRPVGTHIPRLYRLPKLHKQGLPLRPILDMFNSPYHALAKWLAEILEPVRRELAVHSLRDTFEFVDTVESLNISGKQMFSLDVVSLFTNVPLSETIQYLCDQIELRRMNIGLPIEDLRKLLYLCTYNVRFLFNGEIYRQKDGISMG